MGYYIAKEVSLTQPVSSSENGKFNARAQPEWNCEQSTILYSIYRNHEYKSVMQPHLEYGVRFELPLLKEGIVELERVHATAIEMIRRLKPGLGNSTQ